MKMCSGKRASLSQGVLAPTKDVGRLNKQGNCSKPQVETIFGSPKTDQHELDITPREGTPSKSISIEQPKQLRELTLSDVDTSALEEEEHPVRRYPYGLEVLVTEANNDAGDIAVETKTFKVKSPARVICHSPSETLPEGTVPAVTLDATFAPTSQHGGKEKESGGKDGSQRKKKRYLPVQSRYRNQATSKDDSIDISVIPFQAKQASSGKVSKKFGNNRAHSTPYLLNAAHVQQASCDGSLFDITKVQSKEPLVSQKVAVKKSMKSTKTAKVKGGNEHGRLKDACADTAKKCESKDGVALSQLTVDLHYTRLLQMQYLNMKAKQAFEKQEEKAKANLYGLWTANCKLEKEINQLKKTVETGTSDLAVEQLLKSQVDGLQEVEKKFSKLLVSTSKIEDALTNTAHYLPISNVIIDQGKLIDSLDESKKLLGEIIAHTRNNQPTIEELSKNTAVLKRTLTTELAEQKQCRGLLATCRTLTNHERSLQVQYIQSE